MMKVSAERMMEQTELGAECGQLRAVVCSVKQRHGKDWFERLWCTHLPATVYLCLMIAGFIEVAISGWAPWGALVSIATWWLAVDAVPRFLLSRAPGTPAWALQRVKLTIHEKDSLREFAYETKPGRRMAAKSGWMPTTGGDLWVLLGKVRFESSLRNALKSEGCR